jgi:hypothetical protein
VQPAASVDVSSGSALLESLTAVPASQLGNTVASATSVLPGLQAREKQAAQASVPSIEMPTGLPTTTPHTAAPTALPPAQSKAAPAAAAGKVAQPAATPPTPGPVPGSQVSVAASEPAAAAEESGGSWWSWLVDRLRSFFGSLPTSDPNLSTSAGPRQRLSLDGDADPAQNERKRLAAAQSVQSGRAHADCATSAPFGEKAIAPTVPRGKLRSTYRPSPTRPAARTDAQAQPGLPADEREKFDQQASPWVAAHVAEQDSGYRREQAVYESAAKKAQEDGARQLAEENERTRTEQVAMRDAAKADVSGARQRGLERMARCPPDIPQRFGPL